MDGGCLITSYEDVVKGDHHKSSLGSLQYTQPNHKIASVQLLMSLHQLLIVTYFIVCTPLQNTSIVSNHIKMLSQMENKYAW